MQKNAGLRLQERYIGLRRGGDDGQTAQSTRSGWENAKIGIGGATSANVGVMVMASYCKNPATGSLSGFQQLIFRMRPSDVSVSTVTRPGCVGTHANVPAVSTSTIRWGYFRIPPSPNRHLCSFLASSIGTVPPHRWPDSSALQPLHSAPLQFRRLHFHFAAFRRPQTAETGKDSGAPGDSGTQRPRCSAYRPASNTARGSACRRSQAIWPRGFARPRHQQ